MGEEIGIVCTSCKHFNYVFDYDGPLVILDLQKAAKGRPAPTVCEACGAALPTEGDRFRPKGEARATKRETAEVKRREAGRTWNQ